MDGTIYLGDKLFERVNKFLTQIENNGAKFVFITNNSSKSVSDYVKKLSNMGIKCDQTNFYTSTQASCQLLKQTIGDKLVYVQGTKSFVSELVANGLNVTTVFDDKISAVLVGFDSENNSEKMRTTCEVLTKLNVLYYATNPDWVCPVEFGYVPDCGSMCFGYEKATGKIPVFIGKPNPLMINSVIEKFGVNKEDVVVIGDRIYTDIASGVNAGVDTILVLSGEATIDDYNKSEIKPTFVLNRITELLKIM